MGVSVHWSSDVEIFEGMVLLFFQRGQPPLPASFPLRGYPINDIRQVWNVIEGQQNGLLLLIFDSFVRGGKAGWYCTFIACQTQQNPFGTDSWRGRVIQTGGWTVFYRSQVLQTPLPWTMGIQCLDDYVNKLQVGGWPTIA